MDATGLVVVGLAGFACGAVNAVAGGGSLLLYPVLVATGIPTLAANVTNSVITWPGYVGGVAGWRQEIRDQRGRLPRLLVATLAGSTIGCVLLLSTPVGAFDVVVPGLVLAASIMLAFQPVVRRRLRDERARSRRPRGEVGPRSTRTAGRWTVAAVFAATIYGGYFGGALGVVLIGILALTLPDTLNRLTALRSPLSLLDATISVVIFGTFGPVRWTVVALAAPTTLIGGYLGAGVARRVDERVLRAGVVTFGLAATVYLAVLAATS